MICLNAQSSLLQKTILIDKPSNIEVGIIGCHAYLKMVRRAAGKCAPLLIRRGGHSKMTAIVKHQFIEAVVLRRLY